MNSLRSIFKWIGKHRILSLAGVIALIAAGTVAKNIWARSQGILSDPLERGSIIRSVYGIGTVMATRTYQIKPGVTATISALYVKEGDSVTKGQKLLKVDSVAYFAPFSGIVTNLPFKSGENLFLAVPALTLVDLSDRYLVVALEQQGALRVKQGQIAKLSFDTLRQTNYDGVVESVYSFNGNFLARIDVSKLPANILPDMTADVAITLREKKDVITVPVAALDNGSLWIKRGRGIPTLVSVKTGIIDAVAAEIVSGDVQVGDRALIKKKTSP